MMDDDGDDKKRASVRRERERSREKTMMDDDGDDKKRASSIDSRFTEILFSWSLEDIFNENLYANQVVKIPESFQTVGHYLGSFVFPVLEETRAELCSSMEIIFRAPSAEVIAFDECKPYGTSLYDVKVDNWRNRFSDRGKEPYRTLPGDIFVLADAKPETISDLQRVGRTWTFALVTKIPDDDNEDDSSSKYFRVKAAKDIEIKKSMQKSMFVVFLMNVTTNKRIWNALHKLRNLTIIKEVLCTSSVVNENCHLCLQNDGIWAENVGSALSFELNESQTDAVLSCLRKMHCYHKPSVELIWGLPGTGKTKTVSSLLFTLLKTNCRILTCAPTNVAITELASRVLKLVKDSFETDLGIDALLGDILLFGNEDQLKVGSDIEEIFLDYRVERLTECFAPLTGWKHCFSTMIDFLENCVSQYDIFVEYELIKEKECGDESEAKKGDCKSFIEYVRDRFVSTASPLRRCVFIFCTHIPRRHMLELNFQNMLTLIRLLDRFETLLFQDDVVPEELKELFSRPEAVEDSLQYFVDTSFLLCMKKRECLSVLRAVLRALRCSLEKLDLPSAMNKGAIMEFCFRTASLIFCTASSSYKLNFVNMEPLNLLVIDEAAQLKECESAIPLQLPGISHAILIGDECQLPAVVNSNVSAEAGFGRSLFERLSSMGHSKHLLNIQYRMHPSISRFPNSNFYLNRILDAPNVKSKIYEKHYLPGPMYGPYSFINIIGGREEEDDVGRSRKNMVEVAVVMKLVRNLYKAWNGSKEKLSVGVVSPYAAQVVAIQEKLGRKYENIDGFAVKVKSVDGFQGGEEDIIIISTVRSNSGGNIGFISNSRRTNVSLTRARHCLWILGDAKTLAKSESVWEALVCDAKDRNCFFNADDDKDLAKAILEVKKELDQLDDILNGDSILFERARWKVLFSDDFRKSFGKLMSVLTKKLVLNLLLKLSSGWRPKWRNVDTVCGSSQQILKQFKVEGLYIICTIDIVKELGYSIQVLKIWDILPLDDIPKLVKRLDSIFGRYTDEFINHCKEKCLQGNLEVPRSWASSDIVRYKNLNNNEPGSHSSAGALDSRSFVENSKVSESLLLMKFYSLSSNVVNHLLSDRDGKELDLPFEVTDEELEIILFNRSTFILGRSGTGKTTVLTMKLFQKEQQHHIATKGFGVSTNTYGSQRNEVGQGFEETKESILRQLFVTVSPKLCYAVKRHLTYLKSFSCDGNFPAESSSIDMDSIDEMAQFKDIQDSFVDIPPKSYPLVITFHKFLMMLDRTVGNSYFERFIEARALSQGQTGSLRSVALQTFIRKREVNYDRFISSYWPHFNTHVTKKLDSSRVFTEIMSHIKGGLRAGEARDGKLNREDYIVLSEGRVSTLSRQKREIIYDIFQDYEKMKMKNGEFDLADLVIDLHRRLRDERYEGEEMDFVYIDEVQDLTLRQIALFKYVCRNVNDGFVFSGDTAQTIARGIDFRFQDIRSLFYNEFMLKSRSERNDGRKEKGQISEIFNLSQNFRTHSGVLKLAQSVIDLLYRFFPQSIDVLKPETSLIYGEAPVLLEYGNDENAIITIFGNSGNVGGNIVVFGAEQVILVRDDCARKEISDYVGKQALVLTIVECKGLEFQDVLLYNFFGSSPLKNQWRVIYEFMKEQSLLDANSPVSFPSFDQAKHNALCSDLKQLYVAITRTRQRLWICENVEELSKPMYDYWKKLCLVQVRQLDDSLAQAMQVASSPEEWKSRGMKLLCEHNYERATMCFERAGDSYWENLSKAAGLNAAADRMHCSNPEMARVVRREAAEIFDSIGKFDDAAECFFDLEEYERAGRIYLEKCGDSKLAIAGECFSRAGCYALAAEVYARGNFFSECLSVCTAGKLFDMGLQYIQYWKQHAATDNGMIKRSKEVDKIEQEFLESCALHYHELKDNIAMMKFVKAFHSMNSMRTFLRTLGCLDELLLLEEESGNYLEAANIAKLRGDLLLEAELLGKAGHFKEASMHILWYVFSNSLWAPGSKGWPLKKFTQKEELLRKAQAFAKNESGIFYEVVCADSNILSNEQSSLFEMKQYMSASQRHKSLRGEILSARKILDVHLQSNASKYEWEDELVIDLVKNSDDRISKNQVSVETLVYFWNFWKEKIVYIFESLGCIETQDVPEYRSYREFCLNYFGVWRQFNNLNTFYLLLNSHADWVRKIDDRFLQRNRELVSIDFHQFVSVARSHWRSELLSVGLKTLETLEALYKFSSKNSMSTFCQSMPLIHIFEITKFLLESKFLDHQDAKTLHKIRELPTEHYFGYIFPLDWRESLIENMISLRGSQLSRNLVEEIIYENISSKHKLTYGKIGRVAMMILGSGKLANELYEKTAKSFDGNSPWRAFIENLSGNVRSEFSQGCASSNFNEAPREVSLVFKFNGALGDTYNANWREEDYISPGCFLYLIDRLLIWVSYFQGYIFTTKSSFVEWLIYQEWHTNLSFNLIDNMQSLGGILDHVAYIVQQLLYNKQDTKEWIKKSKIYSEDYYPLLVLRLFVILCLLCVNSGKYYELLFKLLGHSDITSQLPQGFYDALRRRQSRDDVHVNVTLIAKAFKKIDNPLVIVSLGKNCSKFQSSDSIFVDMKVNQCREDILKVLFPKKVQNSQSKNEAIELETTNSCSGGYPSDSGNQEKSFKLPSSKFSSMDNEDSNTEIETEGDLQMSYGNFWELLDALNSAESGKVGHVWSFMSIAPLIKVEVKKIIHLLTSATTQKNFCEGEEGNLFGEATSMLDELKQLSTALDVSELELEKNVSRIGDLFKRLRLRRPKLEPFFNQFFLPSHTNVVVEEPSETSILASGAPHDKDGSNIRAKEIASGTRCNKNNRETEGNEEKGNDSENKKGEKGEGEVSCTAFLASSAVLSIIWLTFKLFKKPK